MEQQHEGGDCQRHGEPRFGGVAHTGGDRLPADHNGKHSDIGADTGKGPHLFPGLLLHRKGGQHRPVGNIIEAIEDIPQNVGNREYCHEPVIPQAEIGKQHQIAGTAGQSAQQHGRFEASVAGTGVIYQQAHQRVVERIKHTQHGKHHAGGEKNPQRKIENIGKVVDERIGFKRVEHIPADGAKAEEHHVSSVQPIHSVFSSCLSQICSMR